MLRRLLAFATVATVAATPANADSVYELAQKLPPPSLTSEKSIGDLEYCIGIGIGEWLKPVSLHGDGKVLVYGDPQMTYRNAVYMVVQISDQGQQRAIAFAAHKGWDDKTEALIRSCI